MKIFYSFGLLAIVGLSSSASMAASKTLGASACQTTNESNRQLARGETDITSMYGDFSISCPILRDNPNNTTGLSALQFRVVKNDATTRSCTAYSADGFGSALKSVVRSVSGTGIKTFDWGTSFNTSGATTYYSVRCTLGASDWGENLYWSETTESGTTDRKIMPGINAKTTRLEYELSRSSVGLSGTSPFTYGNYIAEFPVLRDQFTTTKTLTSLSLRMYHGNANASAGCTATVTDNYHVPFKVVAAQTPVVGNNTLTWGSMNAVLLGGYYDIECNLSSDDVVYSYSWAE